MHTYKYPGLFDVNWRAPQTQQVEITPDDAAKVLSGLNDGNRYLRAGAAIYLAKQIENGEWQPNHPQPIVFSGEKLIDGQHRLAAIARSVQSVVANCRFGESPEMVKYIDTGISRSLGDRVAVFYPENPSVNALIATMLVARAKITKGGKLTNRLTPKEAIEYFQVAPSSYRTIALIHKKMKGVGNVGVAVAFVDYHRKASEAAEELYGGIFLVNSPIEQARLLRDFLLRNTFGNGWPGIPYQYAVSACKAHFEGRDLHKLRRSKW